MKKYAIGIMSGTSLDGIDVVLCEIEGSFRNTKITVINAKTYSYEPDLLERIKQCIHLEESNVALICSVNFEIAKAYSDCVFDLCADTKIEISDISFIASHGQTVFHVAEDSEEYVKSSLQIGDGSVLANLTNTTVVSNFRTADIAVGGCGAPLVPYADYILFQNSNKTRLLQNIGGISNVTVVPKQGNLQDVFAFDNGPGNM
ncbi:MAG: anhydro-N-acetylmuramic acid kinase, partial [Firmicutes bacterium]|nr:anhydro-N-acetylmuramic acid kinase [Bacillota bacterium]